MAPTKEKPTEMTPASSLCNPRSHHVTKWRSKQHEMMAGMNKSSSAFYESCQEVLLAPLALTAGSFKRGALRGYYFVTSQ